MYIFWLLLPGNSPWFLLFSTGSARNKGFGAIRQLMQINPQNYSVLVSINGGKTLFMGAQIGQSN
jgi:hypothetical protein